MSLENTLQIGEAVGRKLRGSEVIELVSDLGGGKTAFVRGMAHGMGSQGEVSSPSFTLSNEYQAGHLRLYHFDFYRLSDAGIIRDELSELIGDPQAVIAVEWGEVVKDVLPEEKLAIHIKSVGENSRTFTFTYPENLNYLIPDK